MPLGFLPTRQIESPVIYILCVSMQETYYLLQNFHHYYMEFCDIFSLFFVPGRIPILLTETRRLLR